MSYVAIVVGLSGLDFYIDKNGSISETKKDAQRFRSEKAAETAAKDHIDNFEPCVSRHMSARVEPA